MVLVLQQEWLPEVFGVDKARGVAYDSNSEFVTSKKRLQGLLPGCKKGSNVAQIVGEPGNRS